MLRRSLIGACALALLLFLTSPVFGQATDQVTGTVVGEVRSVDDSPLPGASVSVAGTSLVTRTDVDGRFRLGGVPAGERTLVIEFLGFEGVESTMTVEAGEITSLDATLDRPSFADAVTVRAAPILEGQAKALNQQKTAVNIKNIVSSDQFGRFPDPNAAEATQRIPGITLQRDQGEGRYVIVRGTEARLNSMTINGERIPSPEGDVRQVALDVIPADLLEAIEVSKALTPDMDGDAIGGAVNLVTKRAPATRRVALTAGYGENDLDGGDIASANVLWGQRFSDGRLGVLLGASDKDKDRDNEVFEVDTDDLFLLDLLDGFRDDDFLDSRYRLGRFPSTGRLRDIANSSPLEKDAEEDIADYEVGEQTTAVYGLADLQLGDRTAILAGVRVEATDSDYLANELVFDEEGDVAGLTDVRGDDSYEVVLPRPICDTPWARAPTCASPSPAAWRGRTSRAWRRSSWCSRRTARSSAATPF